MKIAEKKLIVLELEYEEFAHLVNVIAEVKMSGYFKKRNKNFQKSLELVSKGFEQFKGD